MIKEISDNIWKLSVNSNIYLLNFEEPILVDAGDRSYHDEVLKEISKIISPEKISKVLFTHLHYDHTGNIDMFPNAEFFAHEKEIKSYNKDSYKTILNDDLFNKFKIKLKPLPEKILNLKVIHTPGHTKGSVCFYLKEKNIMFSGDTLFLNNNHGRTDLPSSIPEKMQESLDKISKYKINILCPGHDY
ncbi:hypothetical protein CEE44_05260 [Candidatus Woesearchaeota archaeon B3_Woes]|nr:MAG: hypothetical protein CEE44_05260 [Candidatus Woesearchaeota archaeon B3_Woes]